LTWNGTTGTLPTEGLIPVGQGFHVETTGSNPVLTVPTSAVLGTQSPLYRIAGDGAPEASSKTDKVETPQVRFRLDAAFGDTERTSEAIVSFEEQAALGFDRRDARLLAAAPGGTLARLYTTIGEAHEEAGAALQVAALPAPTDGVLQIDLGADVLASGEAVDAEATLAWEPMALPTLWTATLVDRVTGERYDLTGSGSASFSLSAADALTVTDADKGASRTEEAAAIATAVETGDLPPTPKSPEARALRAIAPAGAAKSAATRFVLEIDPRGVLEGTTEPEVSAAYPNPASRLSRVEVRLPDDADVRVALYDVLGRRVSVAHDGPLAAGVHEVEVPVIGLAPGTYVVRVEGS
ncbi:MAG: T9SS type A sorting domain-containing protein, partial [Bacteroidota bacterium]